MSTKRTIVHGGDFHFYEDLLSDEEGVVFLDMEGKHIEFIASPDSISVTIPTEIMDQIAEAWMTKRAEETYLEEKIQ